MESKIAWAVCTHEREQMESVWIYMVSMTTIDQNIKKNLRPSPTQYLTKSTSVLHGRGTSGELTDRPLVEVSSMRV